MTIDSQKQQILQSLKSLDALQSAQVLLYIKELLQQQSRALQHPSMKRQALIEIGMALQKPQE
jgi:hypothetical protein